MVEFIVCFGSDDEKKENKHKKPYISLYKSLYNLSFLQNPK